MPARRANVTRQEEEKECKWVEVKERQRARKAKEKKKSSVIRGNGREGELTERYVKKKRGRERGRQAS